MKPKFIPVDHEKTEWQRYSDSFKPLLKERVVYSGHEPLRKRHLDPTVRGKWQAKAARRARRRMQQL